jgi:hypothetical protein
VAVKVAVGPGEMVGLSVGVEVRLGVTVDV